MKNKLVRFRERIKKDLTFFYPFYKGVKGFYGNGKVFFVCQKPSTGAFPSIKDKMFYRLLKKYGFANAHLTDLIKTRGKAIGQVSEEELNLNWSIFQREIELLKPKLLIAVGSDVYKNLKGKIKSIKIIKITHYAFRRGRKEAIERKIETDMKKAKEHLRLLRQN